MVTAMVGLEGIQVRVGCKEKREIQLRESESTTEGGI